MQRGTISRLATMCREVIGVASTRSRTGGFVGRVNEKRLKFGEAKIFDAQSLYSLSVAIDGIKGNILVARYTTSNGINCLIGHDILRLFDPDINFYHDVIEAIDKCNDKT